MYICICKGITERHIQKAVQERGIRSMRLLCKELGACNQCGKCASEAQQLMQKCLQEQTVSPSQMLEQLRHPFAEHGGSEYGTVGVS